VQRGVGERVKLKIVFLALMIGAILLAGCAQQSVQKQPSIDSGLTKLNATPQAAESNASASASIDISNQPAVYFFYLSTCGFSQAQMKEVNVKLKAEFPQVRWEEFEVSGAGARMRWYEMMGARNSTPRGVPVTIIGQDVVSGYYPGETETKLRAAIRAEIARTQKK